MTFDIDANGIVHVSAKDKGTGKEQQSNRARAREKERERNNSIIFLTCSFIRLGQLCGFILILFISCYTEQRWTQ